MDKILLFCAADTSIYEHHLPHSLLLNVPPTVVVAAEAYQDRIAAANKEQGKVRHELRAHSLVSERKSIFFY